MSPGAYRGQLFYYIAAEVDAEGYRGDDDIGLWTAFWPSRRRRQRPHHGCGSGRPTRVFVRDSLTGTDCRHQLAGSGRRYSVCPLVSGQRTGKPTTSTDSRSVDAIRFEWKRCSDLPADVS